MLLIYRILINLITLISPVIILIRLFKKKGTSEKIFRKILLFIKKKK